MQSFERDKHPYTLEVNQDFKIEKFKEITSCEYHCRPLSPEGYATGPPLPPEHAKRVDNSGRQLPIVDFIVTNDGDYVDLRFILHPGGFLAHIHFTAVISVVNVEGNVKFLHSVGNESISICLDQTAPGHCAVINCPRFVERRLILDDEEEYLPGGTLTLKCELEIFFKMCSWEVLSWAVSNGHFVLRSHNSELQIYGFYLKSSLYPILCEESSCFKEMHEIFKSEDDTEWIPMVDPIVFANMLYFLETKNLEHASDPFILQGLYDFADKYVMENLANQCRTLIIQQFGPKLMKPMLFMAYNYFDIELKDACFRYIKSLPEDGYLFVKRDLVAEGREDFIAEIFNVGRED